MGKFLRISFKLNFAHNTLGCYGLITSSEIHSFKLKPHPLEASAWSVLSEIHSRVSRENACSQSIILSS